MQKASQVWAIKCSAEITANSGSASNKLSEAFLVYQELMSSSLLSTQAIHLEEYQEKLDVSRLKDAR